jgi:translation initiation factor 2 beta subunit (eIF-2beta)/eIF-5
MKNIHILPTENPSRLFKDAFDRLIYSINIDQEQNHFEPQNIYITNSEEIKEGDWFWKPDLNMVFKAEYTPYKGCKKIILTTDQDLIKDGVQAIDDEFIEWFVKNPSCEEVKTRKIGEEWIYNADVPKEPKQETLEEAAERYSSISFNRQDLYDGFIEGASWQQEQILQFLYSEITERRPYSSSKMCEEVIKFIEQFKKK